MSKNYKILVDAMENIERRRDHNSFKAGRPLIATDNVHFTDEVVDWIDSDPKEYYSENLDCLFVLNFEGMKASGGVDWDDNYEFTEGTWLRPLLESQGYTDEKLFESLRHMAHKYQDVIINRLSDYGDDFDADEYYHEAAKKSTFIKSLVNELEHVTWMNKQLVVLANISFEELADIVEGRVESITIPKSGVNVGLFVPYEGGGGPLTIELEKDITVDLRNIYNIQIDGAHGDDYRNEYTTNDSSYSVSDVYGYDQSDWAGKIKLNGEKL